MTEIAFSVLAIACSIAALATSLVVALRTTPQRVRKAAYGAMELAEEMQNGFQVVSNRMVAFMEEVTRERASAGADLVEAERKRRQAAAKLSKVQNADGEPINPPKTLREMLETLPIGDPRRLSLLRQAAASSEAG